MNMFLLPIIIFIGTSLDLQSAPAIAALAGADQFRTVRDPHALRRFPKLTHWAYAAKWTGRVIRKKYSRGFPAVYIVFGRETVSTFNPEIGCMTGAAITCRAEEIDACVEAAKETACRL